MALKNLVKKVAGYVSCGNGQPLAAGDSVRLYLDQTLVATFPEYITAVVQNPVLSTSFVDSSCACLVDGTCYTFQYDTDDLPAEVDLLWAEAITSVLCITCCEILENRFELLEQDFGSTLAYAATLDWDELVLGKSVTLTLTGDADLAAIDNAAVGVYSMLVIQDGVGGHALDLSLTGIAKEVSLDTAAAGRTIITFHYDGTNWHLLEAQHETRITTNEASLVTNAARITTLEDTLKHAQAQLNYSSNTIAVGSSGVLYEVTPDTYQLPNSGDLITFDGGTDRLEAGISVAEDLETTVVLNLNFGGAVSGKDLRVRLDIAGVIFERAFTPGVTSEFSVVGFGSLDDADEITIYVANDTDTTDIPITSGTLVVSGRLIDPDLGSPQAP